MRGHLRDDKSLPVPEYDVRSHFKPQGSQPFMYKCIECCRVWCFAGHDQCLGGVQNLVDRDSFTH